MIKFNIFLITLFLTPLSASAKNITCSIVNDPEASTLLIEYAAESPVALSLKSPMSDEYKTLDLTIEVIAAGTDIDSFSAKPKVSDAIDWSHEPNCFKEVGTQWYFVLNFKTEVYGVYLSPYLAVKNNKCIPPRFRPQPKGLNCEILSQS